MKPIDQTKRKARRIIAERFRRYVAALMRQFTTTSAELWNRAETNSTATEGNSDESKPTAVR